MKKVFLLLTVLLCFAVCVCADLVQQPVSRVAPEDFCIMPWNVWAETEFLPEQYEDIFKDMYDCGFNVSGLTTMEYLGVAKKYGLKTQVLSDVEMKGDTPKDAEKWAAETKKHLGGNLDNVFQVHIMDEPFVKHIPRMRAYGQACKKILGVKPYINLNPNYAVKEVIGDSYEKYCDDLITGCGMDFISYDNYSVYNETGLAEDRFYSNLEEMSKVARKHNVHFMNVILGVGHFNYAIPTQESINVQGFSSIAYGAKGLSYFTICPPQRGDFRGSAYDRYGSRTPVWYYIRNMNFAIHNLWPYMKGLKHINVCHFGNVPKGSKGMESSINLKEFKASSPVGEANAVIGEFVSPEGVPYVMVVNKSLTHSLFMDKISFKNGKNITHIMDVSRKDPMRPLAGEDFWLAPGYGALLKAE